MKATTLWAVLLLTVAAAPAQMRRRPVGSVIRPGGNPNAGPDVLTLAVATFDGTLKAVAKSTLQVEVSDGNVVTLHVDKKTEFREGDRLVKIAEIANGTLVTADAHKVMGQLVAIRVNLRGHDPHAAPEPELKHRN